jgi:hypothetical protein
MQCSVRADEGLHGVAIAMSTASPLSSLAVIAAMLTCGLVVTLAVLLVIDLYERRRCRPTHTAAHPLGPDEPPVVVAEASAPELTRSDPG